MALQASDKGCGYIVAHMVLVLRRASEIWDVVGRVENFRQLDSENPKYFSLSLKNCSSKRKPLNVLPETR